MGSFGNARDQIAAFNNQAAATQIKLTRNPFADQYERPVFRKTDERYGRPESGSKTERRGIQAGNEISKEILELCEIINYVGYDLPNGLKATTFGQLFDYYRVISNKVVGILLRARKHGLVSFDGEMLYQRQDEEKVIAMLKSLDEIKQTMRKSGDPQHCLAMTAKE